MIMRILIQLTLSEIDNFFNRWVSPLNLELKSWIEFQAAIFRELVI